MANNETYALAQKLVPITEAGALFNIKHAMAVVSTDADGDFIFAFKLPADVRVVDAVVANDTTLGAAKIALWVDDTQITADTTAGALGLSRMSVAPFNALTGAQVKVEVETAAISAAANVTVDLICQRL